MSDFVVYIKSRRPNLGWRLLTLHSSLRVGLLVAVSLLALSCSVLSEQEALARLAATEVAASPLIEAAVGSGAVGSWERHDHIGVYDGFYSRMELVGTYSEDVLQQFVDAARQAGADPGDIERAVVKHYRDQQLIDEDHIGSYLIISFGEGFFDVWVDWIADTGALCATIRTGPVDLDP